MNPAKAIPYQILQNNALISVDMLVRAWHCSEAAAVAR